jgi:hypothetical protein
VNIVNHHNPDCGTPRKILANIEAAGWQPTVIDHRRLCWPPAQRPPLLDGRAPARKP